MQLLNSIGLSLVAFVFVLGVMIFIHELGHYLVAKFLGIRVEVFSLGFGTRLIGFRKGDTDYRISLIPLGGYVKMAGENYDEELTGSEDEFLARPKLHRFAVAVAGPVMNIALALVLVAVTLMWGFPVPSYLREPALIGKVEADSPAANVGIHYKDTIVSVEGEKTPTWQDAELKIRTSPNQQIQVQVLRNGQLLTKTLVAGSTNSGEVGDIGVRPYVPFKVAEVQPDTPAARAGLQPGDEILRVSDGEKVVISSYDFTPFFASHAGKPLLFTIERDHNLIQKTIEPVEMNGRARIGIAIAPIPVHIEKYGFARAVSRSVERNYQLTALLFDVLGKLVTGKASIRTLSGPIEIARFSGTVAAQGMIPLLSFMAFVSLQLGIFNLFPIPILDGGVITLLAIEGLMGRDLSLRVKERIFQVGFIFLIVLMGIVIINDLYKTLPFLK